MHAYFRPPGGPPKQKGCNLGCNHQLSSFGLVIGQGGHTNEKAVTTVLVGRWFRHPLTALLCAHAFLAFTLLASLLTFHFCIRGLFLSAGEGLSLSDRHATHNRLHGTPRPGSGIFAGLSIAPGVLGGEYIWL